MYKYIYSGYTHKKKKKKLQIHILLCLVFGKSCCHWDIYANTSKVCRQSHASFIPQFIKTSRECIMARTKKVHPALLFHNRFDGRQTIVKVLQTGAMFCNICKLIRHSFNVLHLIGCLMSMYILKGKKSVKGDKDDNWVHSEGASYYIFLSGMAIRFGEDELMGYLQLGNWRKGFILVYTLRTKVFLWLSVNMCLFWELSGLKYSHYVANPEKN